MLGFYFTDVRVTPSNGGGEKVENTFDLVVCKKSAAASAY